MAIITKATGHIQNLGSVGFAENGNILGTVGQSLRLEEFSLWLELTGEHAGKDIGVEYEVHIQNQGWGQTFRNGEKAGTEGQGLRIEAVRIRLIGSDAAGYKIWYHPHVEGDGWLGWCSDGESSGTEGGSLRVEALQIVVLSDSIDLTVDVTEKFKKIEQPIVLTPEIVITPAMQSAWGKYFTDYEFACDCIKGYDIPNPCDGWPETDYGKNPNLIQSLIDVANAFREYINCPVVPTCGTRCESSNDYWGGVPDSLHKYGLAFDMTVPGQNIVEMARIMYQVFGKSVRVYPDQEFMHVEESQLDGVYNQEQGYYIY
jgi:uncharacterized protein YjdB